MDSSSYENLVSNLANATRVKDAPPPVLDDQINFLKETGKVSLETIGGGLAAKTLEGSIKGISKVAPDIAEAAEGESDVAGLAGAVVRGGLRAGARAVQGAVSNGIQTAKTALTPVAEAAQEAGQETTAGLESITSVLNKGLGSTVEDALPGADTSAPAESVASELFGTGGKAAEGAAQGADEAAVEAASKATEVVDKATEVENVLKKGTEISEGEDAFDPAGLAITGALGLAAIVSGLFVKTHKTVNVTPKFMPQTLNYGTQAGVL